MKLFVLVTCTCMAVFLQALVSILLFYSELSQSQSLKIAYEDLC